MGKKEKIYRSSRQRERILQLLQEQADHPRADWIYERLKEEFPALSMGNVYRNLKILVEQGRIKKISFGSTFDLYDGTLKPHCHFICEQCRTVKDLDLPLQKELIRQVRQQTSYQVHTHDIQFYGLCDHCQQNGSTGSSR